jgi:hypothetical protein
MLKLGATFTVSATVAVSVSEPEVPVIVTVTGPPAVAVLVAVSVKEVELLVAGFGSNVAVTPLGKPEAEKLTLPVKLFTGAIVILSALVVLP